jgi:hypothetical protein
MHVHSISIRNLRTIEAADIEFNTPDTAGAKVKYPNVTVLLGSNGAGKSTVLRSIAMAILAPVLEANSGFVPDGLVRRLPVARELKTPPASRARASQPVRRSKTVRESKTGDSRGPERGTALARLGLDPQDIGTASTRRTVSKVEYGADIHRVRLGRAEQVSWLPPPKAMATRVGAALMDEATSAFFLVGYGATRRVEDSAAVDISARKKARVPRYQRVAGLFEEHYSLVPLSSWLPAFGLRNPGRYKQVRTMLDALLPEECALAELSSDDGYDSELRFLMHGVEVPFRALSDGFRAYVGWLGDMLYHLCMGAPSGKRLNENRGVILIDEIDLHLHPDWQRWVLPKLSETLPHIQFIVTTHSPLVVGSLQRQNIVVLQSEGGLSVARQLPEKVHGRSAEQILLSPYFGLESTRAPDVAAELEALRRRSESGDSAASIKYLELLATGKL